MAHSNVPRPNLGPAGPTRTLSVAHSDHHVLRHLSSALQCRSSNALDALLKIAEAKYTILLWQEEVVLTNSLEEFDAEPKLIAIKYALAQVDQAEVTILNAFCLGRLDRGIDVAKSSTVRSPFLDPGT